MNLKIVKNKYLNAVLLLMLFSASIHMILLICLAVVTGEYYLLNYFNIIDIDVLFPRLITDSFISNVLASTVAGSLYGAILWMQKEKKKV